MSEPKKVHAVPDIIAGSGTADAKGQRLLNEDFAHVFNGPQGQVVLKELRRITRDRVLRPPHVEGSLAYMEGARALLDVIEQRIQLGREKKPDVA